MRFALPEGSGRVPAVLTLLARHGEALDGTRVESPTRESVFGVSWQSSNGLSIGAAS